MNNGGGAAYGGHAIELMSNGQYREWSYSDIIGDENTKDTGHWTAEGLIVNLISKDGRTRIMHLAQLSGKIYLLSERQVDELPADPSELEGIRRGQYLRKVNEMIR